MQTTYSWVHPLFPQEDRYKGCCSEEESQDFSSQMLPPGLLVVHDAVGRREDDVAEGTSGQQVHDPLLNLIVAHIKAGADHAALVDAANQIYDNFAGPVVVHHLELPDVSVLHHDSEEPDDHLGAGTDHDLPLASLLVRRDCGDKLYVLLLRWIRDGYPQYRAASPRPAAVLRVNQEQGLAVLILTVNVELLKK